MNFPSATQLVHTALVLAPARDGFLWIRSKDAAEPRKARLATGGPAPGAGVEVLVAGSADELFVIGILGTNPASNELRTENGATAARNGERLELRSPEGALLVEYDAETGAARIHAPDGDLELVSQKGAVRIRGEEVELHGRRRVRLGAGGLLRKMGSWFTLSSGETRLRTPRVSVAAPAAELKLGRTKLTGDRIDADVGAVRMVARRLDLRADTVRTRANRVFQRVDDVVHTLAGRLKTLVRGRADLDAETTTVRSRGDTRINGKKIHLG